MVSEVAARRRTRRRSSSRSIAAWTSSSDPAARQGQEVGLYLRVLKNTLARRAVQGTPFEKLAREEWSVR